MSSKSKTEMLQWSDIDKVKFYGIGTCMYSALTVLLHPITVLKIRQQTLSSGVKHAGDSLTHQASLNATLKEVIKSSGFRGLYRGLGLVVSLAIPARVVYIGVLESSRQDLNTVLTRVAVQAYAGPEEAHAVLPLVSSVSGGLAGGIAAVSAQLFVVPMDVVSQKQMVMNSTQYAREGSALSVIQSVLQKEGWRGLYKGFGLSMVSSLPTGTIWWATYSGCQHWLHSHTDIDQGQLFQRGATQVFSGMSAALVASTMTQGLDVVKTRLQVGLSSSSMTSVARQLMQESGFRGFFRGLGPRIMHMGIWGTVLSSAYEFLRHISRKVVD